MSFEGNPFVILIHAHDHVWRDLEWPTHVRVSVCELLQGLWIANLWAVPEMTANKLSLSAASEEKGSPSNKGISGEIQRAEPKS